MQLDRRSFLGLAAMGSLAAGAGLAGCAPKSKTQTAIAETAATTTSIPRKEGKTKENFDVAIVGAGAAGLLAAYELTKAGKKVAIIEKGASASMSDFSMCGGPTACETKLQKEEGAWVTLDTIFNYMNEFSRTSVNGALLRRCLSCTGTAIDTMLDLGIGMTLKEDTYGVGFRGRHLFTSDGEERVSPLTKAIEAQGGKFFYSNGAQKIIMNDNAAAGVQTEAGTDIMAPATVICTGGFLGGEEMQLERFNTKIFALGNKLSDGTGIKMVVDAGGAYDRNFAILGNECGAVAKSTTTSPFYDDYSNVNEHFGYWLFGGLYTDTAGERFINEYRVAQFPLAIGGEALVRTSKAYVVMDSDYYEGVKNEGIYAFLGKPENWASGMEADFYKTTPENAETHLQQAISEGWAAKADTIAELARKFNLGSLEQTVAKYNDYCAAGIDAEFGKDPAFLKPVAKAPFYIFEYVPSAWGTNGGVKVDSHLRAMDADNNPIPGLYVAGTDQGSVYSVPYYSNEGSSVGLALGSGVLVSKEILGA